MSWENVSPSVVRLSGLVDRRPTVHPFSSFGYQRAMSRGSVFTVHFDNVTTPLKQMYAEEIRRDHGPKDSGATSTTVSSQPTSTSMSTGQAPPKQYEWNELSAPPKAAKSKR